MVAETIINQKHNRETPVNVQPANENDEGYKPGRPRSQKSRKAILEATRKLMAQMSMNELSIEAIAKKAKVGKTTIYRWWPCKAAVVIEAFMEQPHMQVIVPAEATARAEVICLLENMIRMVRGQNGRMLAGIIAESQSDPIVMEILYERFLKDRVGDLYDAVERGQKNGEFRAIDLEIAVDMLMGPLFLRVLSGDNGIDDNFAARYPQQAVAGLRA